MALEISRILHAGYVFKYRSTQIAFDPIFENPFSRNCLAFPNVEFNHAEIRSLRLDAVFISHYHDDHCSLESLNFLDRATPIYLYCVFEELFQMIRALGFKTVVSLKLNQSVSIGTFEVTPRRALDADVDSIFQIRAGDVRILNIVDSWIDDETLELLANEGRWDMILWPFQTMRELEVLSPRTFANEKTSETLPPEWIAQLRKLNPRYVVPSSCQFIHEPWSWYNHALFPISYEAFATQIRAFLPNIDVVRMNPSTSYRLSTHGPSRTLKLDEAPPLPWVRLIGRADVDYEYRPELTPPSTGDIAKHFTALTDDQNACVQKFCEHGLLEKFRSMEPSEDRYFDQTRLWRLRLFDHTGAAQDFIYELQRNRIERITKETRTHFGWTTDVPKAKLYSALAEGESLTSMYVRINDYVEKDIVSVDVVEDPLVRCLFNGVFGAYQAAQLKKIKASRC